MSLKLCLHKKHIHGISEKKMGVIIVFVAIVIVVVVAVDVVVVVATPLPRLYKKEAIIGLYKRYPRSL